MSFIYFQAAPNSKSLGDLIFKTSFNTASHRDVILTRNPNFDVFVTIIVQDYPKSV